MEEKLYFGFGKIFLMMLSNGLLWTMWLTVYVPKAILLDKQIFLGKYIFLLIFSLGFLFATISISYIFSKFRTLLSRPKIVPILFKIFSLAFIYFALAMLYDSLLFFTS